MSDKPPEERHPYQGLLHDDDRLVINGVSWVYARPRQREFWDRYTGR